MRLKLTHAAIVGALIAAPATAALAQDMHASHSVTADKQDRKTTVEFKTETRLPGITLKPGTYQFKLREPRGQQRIVEVWNANGTSKLATLLTVDYPTTATTNMATVLYPNATSPTVRAWYFPGEPVGRAFVYTEDEARALYGATSTPVLYATWDPHDARTVVEVKTYDKSVADQVADAAKAVGGVAVDAAKAVGSATKAVANEVVGGATLTNPTESRKRAHRELEAAERTFDAIRDRLDDAREERLERLDDHLDELEDTFEDNKTSWMTHYKAAMAEIDALAPERPVGTSGGTVSARATFDATTIAQLGTLRAQLRAFHAAATAR